MKQIKLTRGEFAIIDDEDCKKVSGLRWSCNFNGPKQNRKIPQWSGNINGIKTTIIMSRLIMDAPKGMVVDHIDGNTLDNRKQNLRICTMQENNFNKKPLQKAGKLSKYKGVSANGRLWRAYITRDGKRRHLGNYENQRDAAIAYNNKAIELFGEYARLNDV